MARKRPSENLVGVAVMAALRHPLTYRVPQELDVRAGHRVLVPLGKRRVVGIALEPVTRVAPGVELRDILRCMRSGCRLNTRKQAPTTSQFLLGTPLVWPERQQQVRKA